MLKIFFAPGKLFFIVVSVDALEIVFLVKKIIWPLDKP